MRHDEQTTRRSTKPRKVSPWLLALGLVMGAACSQSDFGDTGSATIGDSDGGDDGPGQGAREDEDVTCESDDDCGNGETCLEGVCQMARCKDGPYVSAAPLQAGLKFFIDSEFVVADATASDGNYFVDGYAPEPGSIEYPGSWNMGGAKIVDVAGGDFFGKAPELFAVGTEGSTEVKIGGVESPLTLDVGFQPRALAAGDVDRDKKDEVVVLGQFGNLALCHVDEGSCSTLLIQNGNGVDAVVADVDGDNYDEAVLLLEQNGTSLLYVWAADAEQTGEEDFYSEAGHDLMHIDAGDLDGDGVAEVVGIEDDGLVSDAKLYVYGAVGGEIAQAHEQVIDATSRDISLADLDMDQQDEVVILREQGVIELLEAPQGAVAVNAVMTHQLQVSADPDRIDASDFDGDSPRTTLMNEEPVDIAGPVIPQIVVHFPPYDAERSNGLPVSFVGNGDIMGESLSDTVSLHAQLDVGVSASLFDLFKASLGARVRSEVSETMTETTNYYIGRRTISSPAPELAGFDYGLVLMSCACFHAYYYEVEDPAGRLGQGGDGEQFVMLMPVGGTSTVWSSKRYNAMAEAVGGLPLVEIPYELGNPSSYPTGPVKPDGSPIPEDDFVFPEVPNLLVGDVGDVGWWLSVQETETNEVATTTGLEVYGELGLAGFQFGSTLGASWGQAHSVTIGNEGLFGGTVPPIPDDPSTPEDEYLEHAFAFSPYVYRDHYTTPDGTDASYYVMSFAVSNE